MYRIRNYFLNLAQSSLIPWTKRKSVHVLRGRNSIWKVWNVKEEKGSIYGNIFFFTLHVCQ